VFLGALVLKQSPNDLKQYQAITLDNGLRVLLVHNNDSNKSAAALAVNVGHFNDPKERQGLAHFLEHMLFLGTEKYPQGSEYQKFISQYGGSHNAWTATEHTCFFFDIASHHFQSALDRFSQFFIAPLLSDEFVIKERQNIDAEFTLKLKDDIRRLYDVHKETINQKHPFSQFSVGNLDTLADRNDSCISKEVRDFFNQYYCAHYMTLALEGPQSLADLKTLAEQKFSDVKPAKNQIPVINQPLYLAVHQQIKIDVHPVKNDHQLIISFAMESIDKYYQGKPESILAYLLGHEGKGSVLSVLKKQRWAMSLTAGSGINGSNFKDFNISIALTELGEQHINDIVDVVFSYIQLLKNNKIAQHYYQEKQEISQLSFTYHEKMRPIDSVSQLVLNMHHYPVDDYIYGDYMMTGMSDEHIEKLLNYLSADNMRIIHISQNNSFDQTSFWYQVPYKVNSIPAEKIAHWQDISLENTEQNFWLKQLKLPDVNPYIVGTPEVYSSDIVTEPNLNNDIQDKKTPVKIIDNNGLSVWYKQDTTFKVPKGYLYIGIDSPFAIASIENIAMTRLFVDLYSDTVVEENYDAELAGIHYHLYAHQGGITLQISGISENQSLLLTKLLAQLKSHHVDKEHFDLFKQQLIKHWQNSDKSKSISQLFASLSSLMQPNNPSSSALANTLTNISYDQYNHFCQQLFNQVTVEVLIHGNWLIHHANQISNDIKQAFSSGIDSKNIVQCPVIDINKQETLLYPISLSDHDHASVIYIPMLDKGDDTTALTMITSHLLSPFFFQQMRTEKQYGYIVGVGYVPINRYPGIAFYIQSPHTDSVALVEIMDEFISDCLTFLDDISLDDWQELTQGLAGQLQEKDQNLRIKSQRFWAAICNQDNLFIHKEQLLNEILSLTLPQVKEFISDKLMPENKPDRVILYSQNNEAQDQEECSAKPFQPQQLAGKIVKADDLTKKSKRKY